MKWLLLAAALISGWIGKQGVSGNRHQRIGAVVFLVVSVLCGMAAWWW